MRALNLVLVASFLLAGSCAAGLAEGHLPGIGTFSYGGTPVSDAAPSAVARP